MVGLVAAQQVMEGREEREQRETKIMVVAVVAVAAGLQVGEVQVVAYCLKA
jgi:hypothetical protein